MAKQQEWMSSLPPEVRKISIINLAIPGSHDSMTYGITSKSKIAPDAEPTTRRINWILPWFVRRWAITQRATMLQQLELGVRYFDLRVCQKDNKLYYAHGLFAMEVFDPLYELKIFLMSHPKELVILDFQHFYALEHWNHMQLHSQLLRAFEGMMYTTRDGSLMECTLEKCASLGRQLLVIYRRCPIQLPFEFWPSNLYPTPWPDVASIKKLKDYLEVAVKTRKTYQGYVSQCIITPNGRYIAFRIFSSLRRTAKRVNRKIEPWIVCQCPGPFGEQQEPRCNVFIADFVDLDEGSFCQGVINLNTKLCQCSTVAAEPKSAELDENNIRETALNNSNF